MKWGRPKLLLVLVISLVGSGIRYHVYGWGYPFRSSLFGLDEEDILIWTGANNHQITPLSSMLCLHEIPNQEIDFLQKPSRGS